MCGIHAVVSSTADAEPGIRTCLSAELRRRLCNRGPDHLGQIVTHCDGDATENGRRVQLCLTSTVLSLRGDGVTAQPFHDKNSGSVLCWNGEAWKIDGARVTDNDGEAVFQLLLAACDRAAADDRKRRHAHIVGALRSIKGPFAFVYFDKPAGRLYFGRDHLGRRSLLMRLRGDGETAQQPLLTLSSVSELQDTRWKEVEADGIYVADLQQLGLSQPPAQAHVPALVRCPWTDEGVSETLVVSGIGLFNASTNPLPGSAMLSQHSLSVRDLRDNLAASLRLRVLDVPRPPQATEVDGNARIAILFSGGLDCSVLARMSHDIVPPEQGIDLINVAFENPRVASHLKSDVVDVYEVCPDRVTGRKSFSELQRVCPDRRWRFIAVNVPYADTLAHRPDIISIMHPHNTEMDLSIASALYFSARGIGHCDTEEGLRVPCSTQARVLLSGLGADELFGGYGRHGVAFARQGYAGLVEELRLDVSRLGKRNLGRDDRVMANWQREVRFPYLDEDFVKWAMGLPAWEKCDFANAEEGGLDGSPVEPAKRVLRLAALLLGMEGVAREKKRAIQFGARTAKMESGRVKGTALIA